MSLFSGCVEFAQLKLFVCFAIHSLLRGFSIRVLPLALASASPLSLACVRRVITPPFVPIVFSYFPIVKAFSFPHLHADLGGDLKDSPQCSRRWISLPRSSLS